MNNIIFYLEIECKVCTNPLWSNNEDEILQLMDLFESKRLQCPYCGNHDYKLVSMKGVIFKEGSELKQLLDDVIKANSKLIPSNKTSSASLFHDSHPDPLSPSNRKELN